MNYSYKRSYFLLLCYTCIYGASGSLDTSYGVDNTGIITPKIGRYNNLSSIALQLNDYIYGIGTVRIVMTTSGICSLNTAGIFDTNFNLTGYSQLLLGTETILNCVATQTDGKAIAAGHISDNGTKSIIVRYNTNGSLDTTFNGTGYIIIDIPGGSSISALTIQADGKIVAGSSTGQGTPMFTVMRYNSDGSPDNAFGNNGIAMINPGYVSSPNAVAVQSDGKIVVAGWAWNYSTTVFALARFNADGSPDQDFGINATITEELGVAAQVQAIAIQNNNKIVAGGFMTHNNIHYSFALIRYNENGTRDESFNNNGLVITPMNYSCHLNALAIQTDGKILAGGSNFGAFTTDFALARYLDSGELDPSFGTNGITLTPIGTNAEIKSIIIQSDNKIVAAGISDTNAALARYLP